MQCLLIKIGNEMREIQKIHISPQAKCSVFWLRVTFTDSTKIYSLRDVHYRLSVLSMNIGNLERACNRNLSDTVFYPILSEKETFNK